MTALELRLVGYALAAIALISGVARVTYGITANHYEAVMAKDHAANDAAVQAMQSQVIAEQQRRAAAEDRADANDKARDAADAAARSAVADSVRNVEAALRRGPVPAGVDHPGGAPGAAAVAAGDNGLAASLDRFNAATDRLVAACQHDAGELAWILDAAPPLTGGPQP